MTPPDPTPRLAGLRRAGQRLLGACLLLLALAAVAAPAAAQGEGGPRVLSTTVKAPITPVVAGHLGDGISRAEREGYQAYLR